MQPLSSIVEQLCSSLPSPVDPAACQLLFNKKALELSTPARLANLPAGAKLELRTGEPSSLRCSLLLSTVAAQSIFNNVNYPPSCTGLCDCATPLQQSLPGEAAVPQCLSVHATGGAFLCF